MSLHWLGLLHGFLFGLPTLVLVGHGLAACWGDTLGALKVHPCLRSAFRQRLALWSVLAWTSVISDGLCLAHLERPPTGSLWAWKIGSGLFGALLLTAITLRVRRGTFYQKHHRRLLFDLAMAEAGFLFAALFGALSHYFP